MKGAKDKKGILNIVKTFVKKLLLGFAALFAILMLMLLLGAGFVVLTSPYNSLTQNTVHSRWTNNSMVNSNVVAYTWLQANKNGVVSFSLKNYSITRIQIRPSGSTRARLIGYTSNAFVFNITDDIPITYILDLNRGNYSIAFDSSNATNASVGISATPALVNPFFEIYGNKTRHSLPVGISSFGLSSNLTSKDLSYEVQTDEVVGIVNITAIEAYDPTPPLNISGLGASIQLNALMNVYQNGSLHVYWLQDCLDFNTIGKTYRPEDAIWDYGTAGSIKPGFMAGSANLIVSKTGDFYLYGYPEYLMNYSLPLAVKLVMVLHKIHNNETVSIGYQVLRNDYCMRNPDKCLLWGMQYNDSPNNTIFYDNVTLLNNPQNASITITPYYEAPSRNLYDIDFVFAGEGSRENTSFNTLNATLDLLYSKNGALTRFPSYYTFGFTGEGAYNLHTILVNGSAHVSNGELNPLSSVITNYTLAQLENRSYLP